MLWPFLYEKVSIFGESSSPDPFVSTEEVISLLLQVGLFDKALTIVERFSLSLTPIFEALASK